MGRANPPAIPRDTSREAWILQMDAIASMSMAERLALVVELNDALSLLESDMIRRRHPGYTDRQVFLEQMRRRHPRDVFEACWPEASGP